MEFRIHNIVLFLILACFGLVLAESENRLIPALQHAVAEDHLDQQDALWIELSGVYDAGRVPEPYRSLIPSVTRRTTWLKARAYKLVSMEEGGRVEELEALLQRPSRAELPDSVLSPSGRFKIHFTTTGADATTPEFARSTAETYDQVYDFQINALGYMPPPSDYNVDGPEYDVYLRNISDYGATTVERPAPDPYPDGYTSWIEMDNNFTHTYTKGLDAMRVTAAHEFFHMVQMGYRAFFTTTLYADFLYEMSASWMEDVVFDDVNDYYHYLPEYFAQPYLPFNHFDGNHEYAMAIFLHMLEQKFDRNVIRSLWEEMAYNEPYDALNQTLVEYGSNFSYELNEFAIWNCFTGNRADTVQYYEEGTQYPSLVPEQTITLNNRHIIEGTSRELVTRTFRVRISALDQYRLLPVFQDDYHWILSILVNPGQSDVRIETSAGNLEVPLGLLNAEDDLWLMATHRAIPESNYQQTARDFSLEIAPGSVPGTETGILAAIPNPYMPERHPDLRIRFVLDAPCDRANLVVLDASGERVYVERLGALPAGYGDHTWDGRNQEGELVSAGVYLIHLMTDTAITPHKVAIIR